MVAPARSFRVTKLRETPSPPHDHVAWTRSLPIETESARRAARQALQRHIAARDASAANAFRPPTFVRA
ncbi:hypothetical protein WS70_11360 [Burkholderia mayonis]|uniref:Uncharacterized protein n=1 Tax=Burkholderia mayonis TaxID=1385591 RepID=A0A1B4FFA6_9BURK|nr:hypothetical protein WS70_11360 [Burkholderia mayonis]KVE47100.1 hypothetical protein WS70_28150 [Burkholderia mayonis]